MEAFGGVNTRFAQRITRVFGAFCRVSWHKVKRFHRFKLNLFILKQFTRSRLSFSLPVFRRFPPLTFFAVSHFTHEGPKRGEPYLKIVSLCANGADRSSRNPFSRALFGDSLSFGT